MTRAVRVGLVSLVLAQVTGCAEPARVDLDASSPQEQVVPDDVTFLDTTVMTDGDHRSVVTRQITAAEQRARNATLDLQAAGVPVPLISLDPCVIAGGFRMWDRVDYTGDTICFAQVGVYHLADYGWDRQHGSARASRQEAELIRTGETPLFDAADYAPGDLPKELDFKPGDKHWFSLYPTHFVVLGVGPVL